MSVPHMVTPRWHYWLKKQRNSSANAGNSRDAGLIPGSGNLLEVGMTTHSSILAWRIPWTEEPSGPRSTGCKESDMTERLSTLGTHIHTTYMYLAETGKGKC